LLSRFLGFRFDAWLAIHLLYSVRLTLINLTNPMFRADFSRIAMRVRLFPACIVNAENPSHFVDWGFLFIGVKVVFHFTRW
jgi:hypothetical protein